MSSEIYNFIKYEKSDKYSKITLYNPKKLNAIDPRMGKEIKQALFDSEQDESISAVLITGYGEKAFSVGGDIDTFTNINSVSGFNLMESYEMYRYLERMHKCTIAVVNGYCLAGGLELALACDFIIASDNSCFGLPEINVGIIPGGGGTVRLAKAVGPRMAKQLIFTGEMISAQQAKQVGLLNVVVSKSELMNTAEEIISKITKKSSLALKMAKWSIDNSMQTSDIDAAMAIERGAVCILFGSDDCQEGVKAFFEKRKPKFKGR